LLPIAADFSAQAARAPETPICHFLPLRLAGRIPSAPTGHGSDRRAARRLRVSTLSAPPTAAAPRARPRPAWARALRAPAERPWVCVLLLSLWCGCLFFYGIHLGELWRTEGLRAIVAAEVLHSG